MKTLSNINPELMDILNGWSEWFDYREYDLPLDERGEQDMEYYCSDEYLEEVMAKGKKHMGLQNMQGYVTYIQLRRTI